MAKSDETRERLLKSMTEYVLSHGLNAASLRPLANAAGTSDRMLIYHFGSKQELIAEILQHIAADLSRKLDAALPPRRFPSKKKYVSEIISVLRREPYIRYARVWFEIASAASRGSDIHRVVGGKIIAGYLEWLRARLPENNEDPEATVALALTLIEGALVMDAVGQRRVADRAVAKIFEE